MIDAAFAQRRKTLRSALASWAGSPQAPRKPCCERPVLTLVARRGDRHRAVHPDCSGSAQSAYDHRIVTHVTQVDGPAGSVTARVPAKVNLQLSVGPLREDGYHDLVTVFHAVSLFDELTVTPADRTSVTVSGEGGPAVPLGPANLAVRAAVALVAGNRPARQRRRRGSGSRSASASRSRQAWRAAAPMPPPRWSPATSCGAPGSAPTSWPRSGRGSAATCRSRSPAGPRSALGRGERLTTALVSGNYHWVLAFGASGLSTPDVYAACDRLRAAGARRTGSRTWCLTPVLNTELMAALRSGRSRRSRPAADQRPAAGRAVAAAAAAAGAAGGQGTRRARRDRLRIGADLRVPREGRRRGPRPRGRRDRSGRVPRRRAGRGSCSGRQRGGIGRPGVNLVNLEAAVKAYGERVLLDHVSLGVAAGDRIGVVGRNGSGKTTLLAALAGVADLNAGRSTRVRDATVGYLPQAEQLTGQVRDLVFGALPEHEWATDARARGLLAALLVRHRPRRGRGTPVRRRTPPGRARGAAAGLRTTCCCSTSRRTTWTSRRSDGWPAT